MHSLVNWMQDFVCCWFKGIYIFSYWKSISSIMRPQPVIWCIKFVGQHHSYLMFNVVSPALDELCLAGLVMLNTVPRRLDLKITSHELPSKNYKFYKKLESMRGRSLKLQLNIFDGFSKNNKIKHFYYFLTQKLWTTNLSFQ